MDQDNDTYSYLYGSKESEDFFCATLLLITCLFGILVNFFSAIILLRLRIFNSAFGLLASFNALSNCGVLATFVFWAVPLTYLKYFTIKSSKIGISFINVISFLYFCVYFIDGCDFKYDASTMIWTFGTEPCGLWLSTNIDLRYGVIAFVISSFIDITTLVQLRMANIKLTHIRISSRQSESDAVKIQKREVTFFLQSFANTLMFCGMLVCFHIISYWPFVASSRFASFLSTTYIWGFSHTVSG
ncbi:hypothetical protein WR25_13827 [Diploscapter pachys]|uniref:7TM GPCR serpentine receptor class x (Srx) domain-containing protein n=1 Tax=Diploscapter pachys TaxID=2018661 RepID=A0A2A2KK98_9BILA|nr:hypothetical protein WR25_13827 [Diploscapter pachys]